jgi:hypothetical protein
MPRAARTILPTISYKYRGWIDFDWLWLWHRFMRTLIPRAPVAQLDRAPGFEPGGRRFESVRARQLTRWRKFACIGLALRDPHVCGSTFGQFRLHYSVLLFESTDLSQLSREFSELLALLLYLVQ